MADTSARLLRLLSLLQSVPDWSGPRLAERLGVTTRTVRKDVERLRDLGYPVHATPGAGGGYRLGAGARLPPLVLDDAEAVAVAVGLRTAASGSIAGVEETALRALAKLEQVLPSRLRRQVGAVHTAVATAEAPERAPAATTSGCVSTTGGPAARPGPGRSSRTGWCTPGAGGTWPRGIRRATTGGPSAWTAWRCARPTGRASPRARRRAATCWGSSRRAAPRRGGGGAPPSCCTPESARCTG
ncbi:biotin operon repressor [Streptomonospora nanhaiensis]|uniref:Biotin operon repressor n=1 Tax=Streptomonospora nanhaiensis TaxID=1323731 RepID=A0A853BQ22_9ACTN|nr:biotin operon repressor [Streptomonospora nanhaiensis]